VAAFRKRAGSDLIVLSRFNQIELLQGAKDLEISSLSANFGTSSKNIFVGDELFAEAAAGSTRQHEILFCGSAAKTDFDGQAKGGRRSLQNLFLIAITIGNWKSRFVWFGLLIRGSC